MVTFERLMDRAAYAGIVALAAVCAYFIALAAWDCVQGFIEGSQQCCEMNWALLDRRLGYSVIDLRNALIAATPAAGLYLLARRGHDNQS
jgi:hypothetical protein